MTLRVASFNARGFRAGVDAAARALKPEAPHLVLIQECGPRRRVRAFAGAVGLEVVATHRLFNRIRLAVLFPRDWRLAAFERHDLIREGRSLRRGLLAADLRRPNVRLTAVSAHLGLGARERERHARELTDYLAGVRGPLVMGLDLNEGPDGPAARWIADRLFDAWPRTVDDAGATYPARDPTVRIDYLFLSEGVTLERAWVAAGEWAASASDHRAVLADVTIREP